MTGENLVFVYF